MFGMKSDDVIQKLDDDNNWVTSSVGDALADVDVVMLYFSAHWCPPCRGFTPVLKDAYEDNEKNAKAKVEVVFISSDRSGEDMKEYMIEAHGKWYALAHGSDLAGKLKKDHGVRGIPTLVVVKKDGTVINANARGVVEGRGPKYFKNVCK